MGKKAVDTIAALATPPGKGGVGVVRVSGPLSESIARKIVKEELRPRLAYYLPFYDQSNAIIDQGVAIFFKSPHSFTGEDILELHGHGGPVVLDGLLKTVFTYGARQARAGEFSERAFLEGKIDLAQAEAIADLIDASSHQAARSALLSLQGEFSERIHTLVDAIIHLRTYVEAAIDFPAEEIDFLSDKKILNDLMKIIENLNEVKKSAKQGVLLREGMQVVIAGKPNAGKSSLLNCLSGRETAIVTDIAGTTRDVLREYIQIDGMPLHIIDTAGLRKSKGKIEKEGVRRAQEEIRKADKILLIVDSTKKENIEKLQTEFFNHMLDNKPITIIKNKIDLTGEKPRIEKRDNQTVIYLSAKKQIGIDLLKEHLKTYMGFNISGEGIFTARRRHLDAIHRAEKALLRGKKQLVENKAGELLAEELRQAQNALSEITGEFTTEDLLGEIFSSFCVGK